MYDVDGTEVPLGEAARRIEAALAASPVEPFFGSAPDHELPLLAEAFARSGSELRPQPIQRQEWTRLEVARGDRQCTFGGHGVTCIERSREWYCRTRTLDGAVGVARAFLEDGASFEELSARKDLLRRASR